MTFLDMLGSRRSYRKSLIRIHCSHYFHITNYCNILTFRHLGISVATGEMCANRVMFKQFMQADAMQICQIDSCRLGGVNEILAVYLMAAKRNGTVIYALIIYDVDVAVIQLLFIIICIGFQ